MGRCGPLGSVSLSKGLAVFLCNLTEIAAKDWADAGYRCVCVDTQHKIRKPRFDGLIEYRWGDVRSLTPKDFGETPAFACAFPPCTHFTVSGNQDWPKKGLRLLIDSLEIVEACRQLIEFWGCPGYLENPVGRLSSIWRKPDHVFNPCDYGGYLDPPGDAYTKKTCIWTFGDFVMPPTKKVEPVLGSKMHKMPPSSERANLRSETPRGFARAVFETNNKKVNAPTA